MSDQQELQQLREEVRQLQLRLDDVRRRLEQISPWPAPPIVRETLPPPVITIPVIPPVVPKDLTEALSPQVAPPVLQGAVQPIKPASPPPSAPKESFEVRLGTYWLPRIGITLLLTGTVFFAAYITPRLTVPDKVALGYLTCLVLGILGMWLEKRTPQFARVLQAGSLALAYFVTYAAHFVDAFRIIQNPTLAITMLSVVVLLIVGVAQERQSPTLGGMALFFGYYTSVVSGVTTFTLASNAVLALAALFFLARNRWVTISYGAVLATYLTYMIWVWKLNGWGHLDRLVFDSGYLGAKDFHLRAGFLSLYWLLFMIGGLMVRRDAMAVVERNGLVTLNNAFFFVLFSLLMHHTYPKSQWQFQFPFAGVLLIASSIAYRRYKPERSLLDTLFLQGLAVATLGIISYFKGVQLVAALALESAFLLVLARWMQSRWVSALAGLAFLLAYLRAWNGYPEQDQSAIYGAVFVAAVGFVCARLAKTSREAQAREQVSRPALVFAFFSAMLLMAAARECFSAGTVAWVLVSGAILVAIIGAVLRTREIVWASHMPLLWAFGSFFLARLNLLNDRWRLAPALALVAVTLGFGLFLWGRVRAKGDKAAATSTLFPYAFLAVAVGLVTTWDHCPDRWQLAVFAAETLGLVFAGTVAGEGAFTWLAILPMAVGAAGYLFSGADIFFARDTAWTNLLIGLVLLVFAERALRSDTTFQGLRVAMVAIVTVLALFALRKLVSGAVLTVGWALLGFVLLAIGFAIKQRSCRMAGLVALAFSLARAILHDMARVGTIYRILSFIGLGVILLVLAFLYAKNREKLAKWL